MRDGEAKERELSYEEKKAFYSRVLTIYGRNPVLEALKDDTLTIHRLHLSRSNKPSNELQRMVELAERRGVEIRYHEKKSLSRISKNARQDQGVALDLIVKNMMSPEEFVSKNTNYRILALDRVTNPQNVGMILRSCAAGNIDAVLLPAKGSAPIVSPLTIKASAGILFRLPILRCDSLVEALRDFRRDGATLYSLDSHASESFREITPPSKSLFVLGNESEGVSREVAALCDRSIAIPMNRGVESLNVAVTAALLAFME
ncbi:TrmH family RNA methyltransferase [Nitratifractor sp.]